MRAAIAFVVDALAVEHLRPALTVQLGDAVKRHHIGDHRRHDFRNRRAARHLDDGFVQNHLVHRRGAGGVGLGGLHAAPGGARTPGDQRLGVFGQALEFFYKRLTTGKAEHAVFVQRRVAFHRQNVVAFVLLLDFFQDGFCLMTGGRHDGVVVIQRDHRQNGVLGQRVRRADERFGATGALQPVQPDHRHARLGFQRVGNFGHKSRTQAQRSGRQAAKFEEAATGHPLTPHHVVESLHLVLLSFIRGGKSSEHQARATTRCMPACLKATCTDKTATCHGVEINRWKLALQCAGRGDKLGNWSCQPGVAVP